MATNGAEKVVEDFNNKNGRKLNDFTTKEVMLLLHKETKEDLKKDIKSCNKKIENVDKKLTKHIERGESEDDKIHKILSDHDVLFERMMATLPEKGFCEKVEKTLYTKKGDDKVEILWNDRRWIKYLAVAGFGSIITGMVMVGVSIIT